MTDNSAAIRLQARIDKRDLWVIEADLRQVLRERDTAVRAVTALRELAEKWAGEPTTIEAFLANSILKAIADATGTRAHVHSVLRSGIVAKTALNDPEPAGHFAKCKRCTDPVLVHDDGSTDGGVATVNGILCDRCVTAENEAQVTDGD